MSSSVTARARIAEVLRVAVRVPEHLRPFPLVADFSRNLQEKRSSLIRLTQVTRCLLAHLEVENMVLGFREALELLLLSLITDSEVVRG